MQHTKRVSKLMEDGALLIESRSFPGCIKPSEIHGRFVCRLVNNLLPDIRPGSISFVKGDPDRSARLDLFEFDVCVPRPFGDGRSNLSFTGGSSPVVDEAVSDFLENTIAVS